VYTTKCVLWDRFVSSMPNPKLEDQDSVPISADDRVVLLYPRGPVAATVELIPQVTTRDLPPHASYGMLKITTP
jgi:hypothetical protein